jgi:hypothetical protein
VYDFSPLETYSPRKCPKLFKDPIKQPLRLNLANLLAARKIITPLKEKNPAGILEIEKQAKKISERASSPDKSIFKLERIDMYG